MTSSHPTPTRLLAAFLAVLFMNASCSAGDEPRTPERIRSEGNRLAAAGSLYLRQHGHNPIEWYPWGDEALAKAKAEDKPVFLSIGYSSCHWCHVMEHEVFEHDDVAAYVNEHFVCIKVDREERPDLDAVYMEAVQAMTGRGGWPMSVFLTPDLEPFWGGTYVPHDPFLELCTSVVTHWSTHRDDILKQAGELAGQVNRVPRGDNGTAADAALVDAVAAVAMQSYDGEWGGFQQSQKFPTPLRWRFLLHHARRTGDQRMIKALRHTLEAMDSGGIHDHLGGAFHRYTTERTWLVPHFEIMLYDNAQLAGLYLEAGQVFDEERHVRTGLGVLDFLLRAMHSPEGGFYASFDADSGGEEGSFYVWTPAEIDAVAGQDGPALMRLLGVQAGGNFEGKTILTRRTDETAVPALFELWREPLYQARAARTWPGLDQKVVTAWNGLTISALARAYTVSGEDRYRAAAESAADFLWRVHRDTKGRLARSSTNGQVSGAGILDDYAFFAAGLLDLHQATGDLVSLSRAHDLVETARATFTHPKSGFFLTAADVAAPLGRRVEIFDSVEPSGAAVMTQVLITLGSLVGDPALIAEADRALAAQAGLMSRAGMEMAWWADALLWRTAPFYDVVIAGDSTAADTRALHEAFRTVAPSHAVLAMVPADGADAATLALMPAAAGKTARDGRATAYVCVLGTCQQPVHEAAELRAQLLDGWKH